MENIINDTLAEVRNLWDQRKFNSAMELCDTLISNGYESITVYEAKALTYSFLDENKKALKCFGTLFELYKGTSFSSSEYDDLTRVVFNICEILISEKRYEEALNCLQYFHTKDDDYIIVNTTLAKALIGLERYQEAIEALNVITKCKDLSTEDKREARNLKQKCNRALNPVKKKNTQDIESINATKLFNRTDRYLDKEQYDKAIESAQQIIDGDNESSIGYEFMAMALIGLKRYEEALSYCNMALERITDLETPPIARQLKRDCIDAIEMKMQSLEENVTTYYQNDILQKYVKFGYKSMGDDISITYLENGFRCLEEYEICTMFSIAMPTFLEFIDKEYFDKKDLEVSIKLKGQELLYNDGTIDEPIFYGIELPDTGENVVIYGERKSTLPVLPIDLKITAMTVSDADWNFNITEYDEDYEDGEQEDVFGFYPKEDKTILGDRLQYFKNGLKSHLDKSHDFSLGKAAAKRLSDNLIDVSDCIETYNYIYAMCEHGFTLDADMYSNLSKVYDHLAEYGIALDYLNKSLKTTTGTIQQYKTKARFLSHLDKIDESIETYKVALSLYKGDEDDFFDYIITFLNMGEMFFSIKRYEEAIECFNKVIEYEKEDDIGYVSVARCLLELKEYEKALEYCDLATNHTEYDDDFNFQHYETKAKCLLALERTEEAEKYFEYAESDKPYFPICTYLLWEDDSSSCNEFETREEAFEYIKKNITDGDTRGTNKVVEAQIVGEKLIRSRFLGIDY